MQAETVKSNLPAFHNKSETVNPGDTMPRHKRTYNAFNLNLHTSALVAFAYHVECCFAGDIDAVVQAYAVLVGESDPELVERIAMDMRQHLQIGLTLLREGPKREHLFETTTFEKARLWFLTELGFDKSIANVVQISLKPQRWAVVSMTG
jgi:hypothetical protein